MEERTAAEFRQRLDHAAAGPQKLAPLVRYDDLRALPAGKVPLDRVGEMMHVHHRALDAGLREAVEHVIDQRLAADLHQRLRDLPVERTHARAEARRQHHGAARDANGAVVAPFSSSAALRSSSTPAHGRHTTR